MCTTASPPPLSQLFQIASTAVLETVVSVHGLLQHMNDTSKTPQDIVNNALRTSLQHAGSFSAGSWTVLMKITDYRVESLFPEERRKLQELLALLVATIKAEAIQTDFIRALATVAQTLAQRYGDDFVMNSHQVDLMNSVIADGRNGHQ